MQTVKTKTKQRGAKEALATSTAAEARVTREERKWPYRTTSTAAQVPHDR